MGLGWTGMPGLNSNKAVGYLAEKVKSAMKESGNDTFNPFKYLLYLFSVAYGGGVRFRRFCYRQGFIKTKRLPCKAVSIGNVTAGGTGKTPMTMYLANLIQQHGYHVAVVSRGYQGAAEKKGGIVSDGEKLYMGPDEAGDEPFMMARRLRKIPVIVGKDRFAAGMLAAEKLGTDVVVLDDAFQHLRLERDLDLVLLDHLCPFGNEHLLPRGALREPLDALARCDAVVLTRYDEYNPAALETVKNAAAFQPIFRSVHVPFVQEVVSCTRTTGPDRGPEVDIEALKNCRAVVFSGLANNDDFRRTIESTGCSIKKFIGFADHYAYKDRDLDNIRQATEQSEADIIITTDKDFMKISGRIRWPFDLFVIGIRISFAGDEKAFREFIINRISNPAVERGD